MKQKGGEFLALVIIAILLLPFVGVSLGLAVWLYRLITG